MPAFHRPDENRMNAILASAGSTATGVILRLAWQAGLTREEIQTLTWGQIDLMEWKVRLPGRTVPLDMALAVFLLPLEDGRDVPVACSQREKRPLTPQTISHMARTALTAGGEEETRLTDLRCDYAARLLAAGKDWQAVSRVTGMSAAALRRLGEEGTVSTRARRDAPPAVKGLALEALIKDEGPTPAGLAIALAWRCGLGLEEIAALQWHQVGEDRLTIDGRAIPLDGETKKLLESIRPAEDGYVLATRTARPFDLSRLSRLVRSALVHHGLDDVTLRDLRHLRGTDDSEAALLSLAAGGEGVSLRQAQETLGLSDTAARRSLKRLTAQGKLTRVGLRYYLPGVVVAPAEQERVILEYLAREGFAYRQDIARLLHIPASQCRPVLKRLVESGKLRQENQRYTLL